jgi:hypothetical protein
MLIGSLMIAAQLVITGATAQDKAPPKPERDTVLELPAEVPPAPGQRVTIEATPFGASGNTVAFVSAEMSFDGKVVKGAPYSAEAVTEHIQTLSDGNRIIRRTTSLVYRDSEGRTRRDQTLAAVGPWATAGDPPQIIFINDPVAKVNYILDPRNRTARKLALLAPDLPEKLGAIRAQANGAAKPADLQAGAEKGAKIHRDVFVATPGMPGPPMPPGKVPPMPPGKVAPYSKTLADAKTESLGTQMIEGVEAEGTRSTLTIQAGEIGNELPINIVSEQWYSPALQTVVMTKFSDPRYGESSFRLTNINRSEPAHSLFEVPADYQILEAKPTFRRFHKNPSDDKQ